jgi:4-hydroxy-tetrahydrodipicolinate reductase
MSIKIIINGASGKMGTVTVDAINAADDCELVGALNHHDNLAETIKKKSPDVVIDFTHPDVIYQNVKTIIDNNARPVVGTTGLTLPQIDEVKKICSEKKLGAVIAPNFSISAILMMKYAQDAIKYLPNVEIIELHHNQKADAPSGTALKTAEMMEPAQYRQESDVDNNPARGKCYHGTHIHSVRLPGLFSHQEVLFTGPGEVLTIRHDGLNRNAMMPGVLLACRKVMQLNKLIYGLENLL